MTSIIFVDTEGSPFQELSAIEMDNETRGILDTYHNFARVSDPSVDCYSRQRIHGLQPSFLTEYGFPSESLLIDDFKRWLGTKSICKIYANEAARESAALKPYDVHNLKLPNWIERVKESYHQVAHRFKDLNIPIHSNTSCFEKAHTFFIPFKSYQCRNETQIVKAEHGHHCSLYDAYELYLFYVMRMII